MAQQHTTTTRNGWRKGTYVLHYPAAAGRPAGTFTVLGYASPCGQYIAYYQAPQRRPWALYTHGGRTYSGHYRTLGQATAAAHAGLAAS